ncbi:uncharacterized protein SCHCODRAFT_02517726 [Schizophyllum commune H4-8]|uniref:uncharacterized protein n=1 Tax=Schizophyllum commune (strain H4-8 / FGSC 9210) TaxID=578458 RepID=UPI00215F9DDB|nr:uncharacterized protein SCHCODRAFT_02517726 [Schizophyllum commune H4-8]KAI5886538.1 hypothetical protein SCHCODRAFT_02517726 [Schizophyllum commune H4-8]
MHRSRLIIRTSRWRTRHAQTTGDPEDAAFLAPEDAEFLALLTSTLTSARASASPAPLPLLRPLLFRLQDRALLARVRERVLGVLGGGSEGEGGEHSSHAGPSAQPPDQDESATANATTASPTTANPTTAISSDNSTPLTSNPTPSIRAHFRESLARALFGGDELLRLRLKLAVADFMRKNLSTSTSPYSLNDPSNASAPLSDPDVLAHHRTSTLLAAIAQRVQGIIIAHVVAVVPFLGAPDLPFALRLALQATLPGSPAALAARGRELLHALRARGLLSDADLAYLAGLGRAQADRDVGDGEAMRAGSAYRLDFLPRAARCWVVDELLQSVGRCIVCGGGFVSVL